MNLEQVKTNVLNDIENEIRRVSPNLNYEYNQLEDLLRVAYRYWDKQSKIPSDIPKQMLEDSVDEFIAKYGNIIDNTIVFNWLVKNMNARSSMIYSNIQNSIAVKEDNHVRIHKICDKFNTQFTTFEQLSKYIKRLEKEYDDILLNGITVVTTESLEELSNKFGFVEDNTTERFSELVSSLKEQEKLNNQVELHDFSGIIVTEMKEKKWFNDIKQFPSNQKQLEKVHVVPTYMKYKGTHIPVFKKNKIQYDWKDVLSMLK
jgi:transcriptional regulator NrdR family protein